MKKISIIAILIAAFIFSGCSINGQQATENTESEKLQVAASFYPIGDFTQNVGGDNIELTIVADQGVNVHNFDPKPSTIKKLEESDVFFINGLELDSWAEDLTEDLEKNGVKVVNIAEEIEGHSEQSSFMNKLINTAKAGDDHGHSHDDDHAHEEKEESGHDHKDEHADDHDDHDHEKESKEDDHAHSEEEAEGYDHDHDHDHAHGGEDPHMWLDPVLAAEYVEIIEAELSKLDPENKNAYQENAKAYSDKLSGLNANFDSQLSSCSIDSIVVSHNAFSRMAERYNFDVIALAGLSPNSEPSPKKFVEIKETVEKEGISYIFFEELVSPKIAQSLANETNTKTLVLNPIEGRTARQVQDNEDYIALMEQNLENIVTARECK